MKITSQDPILVVGAGIMGAGIAQIAAQAGHTVFLFDMRPSAAQEAHARLAGFYKNQRQLPEAIADSAQTNSCERRESS